MATKCDNCSNEAQYTTADPGVSASHYCRKCLPHWLHDRAQLGHFPLVEEVKEVAQKVEDTVEAIEERMDAIIEKTEAELKKTVKKKPAATDSADS